MKDVIILGAGGHAKVIADIVKKNNDNLLGFLDDNEEIQNQIIYDNKKVIGKIDECINYDDVYFIIGIGSNKVRKMLSEKYNLNWYTAIHPSAIIADDVTIEEGTVIMPGAIINSGSKIGTHCIVNTKVSIDHDNIIEDFVHISPGATLAGTVHIKESTWICAGATIINNITIEKDNIIGAGAVVIRDILDTNHTFVGVPAKKLYTEQIYGNASIKKSR